MKASSKGKTFREMTKEERSELIEARINGEQIVYFEDGVKLRASAPTWDLDIAYWCEALIKLTGKDLIGKFCKLWDENKTECVFSKVDEYIEDGYHNYVSIGALYFKNAELANGKEIQELMEIS